MAGNSTDPGRSVTSKVTAILLAFADGGVHTLTEIAAIANLPTSTAHRLASELVAWRLLERTEERSYRIGLPLRMIGSEYSESEVCSYTLAVRRALPVLNELSRATGNEVRIGVLRGSEVLTLQLPSSRVTERVHAEALLHGIVPAHAAAHGKGTARLLPTKRRQPSHRGRVAGVHAAHHHLARRPPPETIGDPVDAGRNIAERVRVRQGGDRDADLLRQEPRCCRHRTHRPRSRQRIEAGRQRAVRCVSQFVAPTRN